jgi:head-tail adaptor
MTAGELDRRIRFERPNPAQDDMGGETDGGFTPLRTVWAKRTDLSAAESFKADERSGVVVVLFKVRSSELVRTITTADQITHNGAAFEITGIKETREGRNNYLEFSTVARIDG